MHCILCRACQPLFEAVQRRLQSWRYAQTNEAQLLRADPEEAAVRVAASLLSTDPKAAIAQFLALAEGGSPWSMLRVGWAYQKGEGMVVDPGQAEYWYRRAFECGSQQAQLRLGRIYATRGDYDACEAVYAVGAAAQWAPAMYYLAWVRLRRPRTRTNLESARLLLEQAAAAGDIGAEWDLARLLAIGRFGMQRMPTGFRLAVHAWRKLKVIADEEALAIQPVASAASAERHSGWLPWLRRSGIVKRNAHAVAQNPTESILLP